jgi:hypothetical protein
MSSTESNEALSAPLLIDVQAAPAAAFGSEMGPEPSSTSTPVLSPVNITSPVQGGASRLDKMKQYAQEQYRMIVKLKADKIEQVKKLNTIFDKCSETLLVSKKELVENLSKKKKYKEAIEKYTNEYPEPSDASDVLKYKDALEFVSAALGWNNEKQKKKEQVVFNCCVALSGSQVSSNEFCKHMKTGGMHGPVIQYFYIPPRGQIAPFTAAPLCRAKVPIFCTRQILYSYFNNYLDFTLKNFQIDHIVHELQEKEWTKLDSKDKAKEGKNKEVQVLGLSVRLENLVPMLRKQLGDSAAVTALLAPWKALIKKDDTSKASWSEIYTLLNQLVPTLAGHTIIEASPAESDAEIVQSPASSVAQHLVSPTSVQAADEIVDLQMQLKVATSIRERVQAELMAAKKKIQEQDQTIAQLQQQFAQLSTLNPSDVASAIFDIPSQVASAVMEVASQVAPSSEKSLFKQETNLAQTPQFTSHVVHDDQAINAATTEATLEQVTEQASASVHDVIDQASALTAVAAAQTSSEAARVAQASAEASQQTAVAVNQAVQNAAAAAQQAAKEAAAAAQQTAQQAAQQAAQQVALAAARITKASELAAASAQANIVQQASSQSLSQKVESMLSPVAAIGSTALAVAALLSPSTVTSGNTSLLSGFLGNITGATAERLSTETGAAAVVSPPASQSVLSPTASNPSSLAKLLGPQRKVYRTAGRP